MKRPPTPYPELNLLIDRLLDEVRDALGDNFLGGYLHGAFAIGDFDHDSDVNTVLVVERQLTLEQVHALQQIHADLDKPRSTWAHQLEVTYFPRDVLWEYKEESEPLWYLPYGEKKLVQSHEGDTLTTRWILLEHGVTLEGDPPNMLIAPIRPNQLRRHTLQTVKSWAEQIFKEPKLIEDEWSQKYTVTTFCCLLHSIETGGIESKPTSALWAKAVLDTQWDKLVKWAWGGQPHQQTDKDKRTAAQRKEEILEFIEYAVELGESSLKRFKYLDLVNATG